MGLPQPAGYCAGQHPQSPITELGDCRFKRTAVQAHGSSLLVYVCRNVDNARSEPPRLPMITRYYDSVDKAAGLGKVTKRQNQSSSSSLESSLQHAGITAPDAPPPSPCIPIIRAVNYPEIAF